MYVQPLSVEIVCFRKNKNKFIIVQKNIYMAFRAFKLQGHGI